MTMVTPETTPDAEVIAERVSAGIDAWARLAEQIRAEDLVAQVEAAGAEVLGALRAGRKLLVAGNGGSAAIASHVAAEFLGKCIQDRYPLPAISLAESHSSLTAIGNDYGFDEVFLRGVQAFGGPGDVLIAMSTSGSSRNILRAVEEAQTLGMRTILMVGARGESRRGTADHTLVVPSEETPRIQEVHMLWAHAWCEAVDLAMEHHHR